MSGGRRILLAAFGDAGHSFPMIALALELAGRGHDVRIESWEQWREVIESLGLHFEAAEEYHVFPPPPPGEGPSAGDAAVALRPLFEQFDPELVISDILTLAPSLAAELNGCRRATLIPHLYPVHQPGMPFFATGMMPPRTRLGRAGWRSALPVLEAGLRRGRRELNEVRERIGLEPLGRFHGAISEELVLVGTLPQLEHPRAWPPEVRICGPLGFELPHPAVDPPPGTRPLVLVAPSTAHDPDANLIRASFEALADEPVRVLATANGHRPAERVEAPANGRLVDWLSYSEQMAEVDLVISHGGHGTICRALEHGLPLLVSPALGDMTENGARVQWAGCGLMVPGALRRAATIRSAVRELLSRPRYAERAREIAAWIAANDAPGRAAGEVESLLGR